MSGERDQRRHRQSPCACGHWRCFPEATFTANRGDCIGCSREYSLRAWQCFERRIAKLIDPALNHGLPAFLVNQEVSTAVSWSQYAAAALVSEQGPRASGERGFHTDLGRTGGSCEHGNHQRAEGRFHCGERAGSVGNQTMCAAQAMDLQERRKMAPATAAAYDLLRRSVAFMENDRVFYKDQKEAARIIRDGELLAAVEKEIGTLD